MNILWTVAAYIAFSFILINEPIRQAEAQPHVSALETEKLAWSQEDRRQEDRRQEDRRQEQRLQEQREQERGEQRREIQRERRTKLQNEREAILNDTRTTDAQSETNGDPESQEFARKLREQQLEHNLMMQIINDIK